MHSSTIRTTGRLLSGVGTLWLCALLAAGPEGLTGWDLPIAKLAAAGGGARLLRDAARARTTGTEGGPPLGVAATGARERRR
jgi:hypothetical protein